MSQDSPQYSIGVVERDTGIARDTLRVWERRYGFPAPARNAQGERIYDEAQLRRLQRIRRLLDQGFRPGKLLLLDDDGLETLEAGLAEHAPKPEKELDELLNAVRAVDSEQLERLLDERCREQGLNEFVVRTLSPLVAQVGNEWAQGQLQIYQEHFLSSVIRTFLNAQIANLPHVRDRSPVLLLTLPGEQHTLGLMMVQALLLAGGVNAVNLGAEMPIDQIPRAVERLAATTVGLSFSASYPYRHIRQDLELLRAQLPREISIWVGGEGVRRLRKLPAGVNKTCSLEALVEHMPPLAVSA